MVDVERSLGDAAVALSGRSLLADDDSAAQPVATGACYGDRNAGCCGAAQCALLTGSNTGQIAVKKSVEMQEGETHTKFEFDLGSPQMLTGAHVDQIAMLFTLNTMAEMSVAQMEGSEPTATHIGCNPLDGYIAWRQTLPCASCQGARQESFKFGVSVKVCVRADVFCTSALGTCCADDVAILMDTIVHWRSLVSEHGTADYTNCVTYLTEKQCKQAV